MGTLALPSDFLLPLGTRRLTWRDPARRRSSVTSFLSNPCCLLCLPCSCPLRVLAPSLVPLSDAVFLLDPAAFASGLPVYPA